MPVSPAVTAPRRESIAVALSMLTTLVTLAALAMPSSLPAQQRPPNAAGITESGPVIHSAGRSVDVNEATFKVPDGHVFRAVYVIDRADSAGPNQQLTTIARF
jgi:hypothetical protein